MKSEQIDYVLEILRVGSINKASKNLHLTQPNLSASLKTLEDELGFRIFDRNRNGVSLTIKGKEFINHALTIKNAMSKINSISSSKPISIFNISSQLFSYTLDAFWELYNKLDNTNTHVNIDINKFSHVLRDVITGKSDLGLIYIPLYKNKDNLDFFSDNNLIFNPISQAKVYLCVGPNNPLYDKDSVCLNDLYKYTLVCLDNYESNEIYKKFCENLNYSKFNNHIVISDHASFFETIYNKNVVAFSSKFDNFFGKTNIEKNFKLKLIPFDKNHKLVLGWVHKNNIDIGPHILEFIDILKYIISPSSI